MSAAMNLLRIIWEHGKKDSWERINHAMRNGLTLAIGSGLSFRASDFEDISREFRWRYWVSADPEWIYHNAIINGNESCIKAWEQHCGREPFRANQVELRRWPGGECSGYDGYIHANTSARQRERLAVGFGFPIKDRQWWVTGFEDSNGTVRLASYEKFWPEGKPVKLRKLTHEELAKLCPGPKRAKSDRAAKEEV